ncbi:GDSL esterase/lipase [Citrus sinensis]|uniref:GDSL esterase/lipase n=2 Tax=Citrus sinensis TaxID=2711 RepID=A0ACB8MEY4_CITSI|nr:GDSL esterase/lipase [Citrus sinensis]
MASSFVFGVRTILGLVMALGALAPQAAEAARAFFVFGDSLVDNGNNNYLATTARADSPPYGIDYPTRRPTGRFSNGLNIPDFISQHIGSEPTLPYLSPELTGSRLLVGANFASAGIGILNDTGIQFVNIIRMFRQFEYFQEYQNRVTALIGPQRTKQLVNGALILITVGGNDFVNNYYLVPYSARSRQFSLPDYVKYVISEYRKLLTGPYHYTVAIFILQQNSSTRQMKNGDQRLHDLGARRVLVTGTGPLGCVPAERAMRGRNGQCAADLQRAADLYNPQLVQLVKDLNSQYGSEIFVAVNTGKMQYNFISNPRAFGFTTSKVACCGQGPYNGLGLCTPASNLCPNRNVYAFWDPFHPSERANGFIVQEFMTGSTEYMYPMNLSTIMALDSRT